jgi:hypothetical protein
MVGTLGFSLLYHNVYNPIRSMIGFASNPGTAVLPTCSTVCTRDPKMASTRERSRAKREGHPGSYGTTYTGSDIALHVPLIGMFAPGFYVPCACPPPPVQ